MTVTIDGTNGITSPGGDVASASLQTPVLQSASTLTFKTNGTTTAMTVDASQNVGIGTTSPSYKLDVQRAASNGIAARFIRSDLSGGAYVYVDTAGSYYGSDASANNSYQANNSSNYVAAWTNGTERMRILAAGDIAFGQTSYTTPPTSGTDLVAGGLVINPSRRTTGSAANCNWDGTTGVFYRSTSSLRYKTDIQDATYGLFDVLKLRPITYKGKSEADGDKVFGGFIAEEIDALGLKEFVEYDAEGNPDSLAYANMVSLLTKAIQELNAKVEALEAKLA